MRNRSHAGQSGTAAAPWFSRFAAMFSGLLNPKKADHTATHAMTPEATAIDTGH